MGSVHLVWYADGAGVKNTDCNKPTNHLKTSSAVWLCLCGYVLTYLHVSNKRKPSITLCSHFARRLQIRPITISHHSFRHNQVFLHVRIFSINYWLLICWHRTYCTNKTPIAHYVYRHLHSNHVYIETIEETSPTDCQTDCQTDQLTSFGILAAVLAPSE